MAIARIKLAIAQSAAPPPAITVSGDKTAPRSLKLTLQGGEEGHVSRECNAPQKEKACYRCNEVGHLSRECPNVGGGGGGGMGGGYSGGGGGQECYKVKGSSFAPLHR